MVAAIGEHPDPFGGSRPEFQSFMHYQCATRLHQLCEVGEAFEICFLGAVNVEMVGVGRGDNRDIWCEMVKRAVEFVSLDDCIGACGRKQDVGIVVAQHSA